LGAYLLNATEMGIYSNLDKAAKSVVFQETYQPRKHDHKIYAKYFEIFKDLSFKLEDDFEKIANLQQGL
jgi:gluconokinase